MNRSYFKLAIITLLSLMAILSCTKSNESIISDEVKRIKSRLPAEMNQYTTWVDVRPATNEIIFVYEIKGVDQSLVTDKLIAESKSKAISGLRSQKNMEKYFKRNINLTCIYLDEDQNELMNMTITRNDLGY